MNHSIWEQQSFLSYDFVVVGAGIMGLSVAFELRQKYPDSSIVILERGLLPSGASTRNAGFACFGSATELLHDINLIGESAAIQLVAERVEGLRILEERLGKEKMGKSEFSGYELIIDNFIHKESLEVLNRLCYPIFKDVVYSEAINHFGFSASVKQLIACRQEFQIDSGAMMHNYKNLVLQQDIEIINGAEVIDIDNGRLAVKSTSEEIIIHAEHVFLCTNAFVKQLFPQIEVVPGRGQVVVTKPIPNLPVKGSFHFDEGFYYFRNVGGRLLFGGGRNIDFKTEESYEFLLNATIIDDLMHKMDTIILPNTAYEIDYSWQGIMGFSSSKLPQVVKVDSCTTYAMACNGMGVALSPYIAKNLVAGL